jgi:hypothetical protein
MYKALIIISCTGIDIGRIEAGRQLRFERVRVEFIVSILRTRLTFCDRACIVDQDQERYVDYCVYFFEPGMCGIRCRSHQGKIGVRAIIIMFIALTPNQPQRVASP